MHEGQEGNLGAPEITKFVSVVHFPNLGACVKFFFALALVDLPLEFVLAL